MKAVVLRAYDDDPAVALDVVDTFASPQAPSGSQVVVRVHYAATNPIDYKIMQGPYRYLLPMALPRVPGFDVAGVVVAVGPNVKKLRVGQRVMGDAGNFSQGALAELCLFGSEDLLAVVPDHVALCDAAGVPLAALTSLQALRDYGKVQRGSKVVVRGASGGTGHYAIQLARILGATEIVAISSSKDLCLALGATEVIDYSSQDYVALLKGRQFDAFYDCVGGYDAWLAAHDHILKPSGMYVTIVGDDPTRRLSLGVILGDFFKGTGRKIASVFGTPGYASALRSTGGGDIDKLSAWLADGTLRTVLDADSPFPFTRDGVVALFRKQESSRAKGKLVIEITPEANAPKPAYALSSQKTAPAAKDEDDNDAGDSKRKRSKSKK
jgi:NADPH:quinone reductase-like Zn-dependent oxidoreductase